jgi:hypothetical protein
MKKYNYIVFGVIALMVCASACNKDISEFNPKPLLDAPTLRISTPSSSARVISIPINAWQNTYAAYVTYDAPTDFLISVIDAPGKVGNISASVSVPDFGSVALDNASVSAIQGKETGDFKVTFTPNASLPNKLDRSFNLVINVSDQQLNDDGENASKTTTLTVPVTIIEKPCFSEGIVPGYYIVTEASGNLDGDVPFTLDDLEGDSGQRITVVITEDWPGTYTINEVTAGVWPTYYSGRANPKLKVVLCDNTISGKLGASTAGVGTVAARTFTLNGTLNSDGTISMTWSYVRDAGGTPAGAAKGSYVLTPASNL